MNPSFEPTAVMRPVYNPSTNVMYTTHDPIMDHARSPGAWIIEPVRACWRSKLRQPQPCAHFVGEGCRSIDAQLVFLD
ncbi:MAG: hypothetical protein IT536_09605 [Hyphomicrobiales bacterium]|nr:hypothetical protein [Hyphomicrobiales bacterium]